MIGRRLAAELLTPVAPGRPPDVPMRMLADGRVALPPTPLAASEVILGVLWPGGLGRSGAVVAAGSGEVVRDLVHVRGRPPQRRELVALSVFVWSGDPRLAHGLGFDDVSIDGYPAWHLPGGDTWTIIVHGRGAGREESLRMLPLLRSLGHSVLVISYRNDPGAPAGGDRLYHLGATEWRELEAAADHALAAGARRLVLAGSSMGGAIVCQFLQRSQRAQHTWRVVLDAPVLDWRDTISAAARARGIPRLYEWMGVRAAERRIGLRLGELDQVAHCHRLSHPMLILLGDRDATVPPAASRALAAARPDIVQLLEVPGAGHAQAWNRDPAAYEAAVTRFLSSG